ncbi:MAG: hypothetical protein WCD86_00600 [Ktedonobacteraceae bacterium]
MRCSMIAAILRIVSLPEHRSIEGIAPGKEKVFDQVVVPGRTE